MIRKALVVALVISVAFVFGATSGFAKKAKYEGGAVSGGGSISGVVTLKGDAPAPIMEDLSKGKNAEFCGTHPEAKDGIRLVIKLKLQVENF